MLGSYFYSFGKGLLLFFCEVSSEWGLLPTIYHPIFIYHPVSEIVLCPWRIILYLFCGIDLRVFYEDIAERKGVVLLKTKLEMKSVALRSVFVSLQMLPVSRKNVLPAI